MTNVKKQQRPYISPQSDDTVVSIAHTKRTLTTPTKRSFANSCHDNTGINTPSSSPPSRTLHYSDSEEELENDKKTIYRDSLPQPFCPSSPVPHNILREITVPQLPHTPTTDSTLFHHPSSLSTHKTHVDPVMLFHNKTMGGFNTWSIPLASLSSSPPPQHRPSPSTPKTFSNIIYSSPLYQGFRSSPVHGNSPSSIPQLLPYTFKPQKKSSPIQQQAKTLSKALDFENLLKRKQADSQCRKRCKKKKKTMKVFEKAPDGSKSLICSRRPDFLASRRLKCQRLKPMTSICEKKELLVRIDVNSNGQASIVKAIVPVENNNSVDRFPIREYQSSDDDEENQLECCLSEEETENDITAFSLIVPNSKQVSASLLSISSVSPCMNRSVRTIGSPLSSPYQMPKKFPFRHIKKPVRTTNNFDLVFPKLNSPFTAKKQQLKSRKKVSFEALYKEDSVSESEPDEESDDSCKFDARDALQKLMLNLNSPIKSFSTNVVVPKPDFQLSSAIMSPSFTPYKNCHTGSSSNSNSIGSAHQMFFSSPGFDDFIFRNFVSLSPTTK